MYRIERRDEVTSTNDICIEKAHEGLEGHYVCSARMQTKGRGRNGRSWVSEDRVGLYLSIMERPSCSPQVAPLFSLVMGLAAYQAVKEVAGIEVQLKWPNDLVVHGKKLSGILAQMELNGGEVGCVVVGIGVNLFQKTFPVEIEKTATSVFLETGQEESDIFYEKLEKSIVKWWETYYNQVLSDKGFQGLKCQYEEICVNIGKEILVLDPKEEYQGICEGITEDGSLIVRKKDDTLTYIRCGEVSVRGIYGYV